ncbi:O-antigen ligase family protein [Lignipirellula cremea]|uniref:O-Antigen ligase n=1 Tax=Lignipirellula cremea TaxID=2528010 RepID=A0A518DPY6_9BACT|nr:O-antigen ligase family protein [Lignipirellula cremea]QDU93864.1 O-Antigen ligase [Lignipirellula cremea]
MATTRSFASTSHRSLRLDLAGKISQGIDFLLAGVFFVVPLFMGGVHPFGRLLYISLVGLLAIGWCLKQAFSSQGTYRPSGVEWLLLGGFLATAIQIAPLPGNLLQSVSPALAEMLPAWSNADSSGGSLGCWQTLSFTPYQSRLGIAVYLSHALLFIVLMQRLASLEDIQRLLRVIACATVGMATLGVLQVFAGNGRYLWVYDYPFNDTTRDAVGTFGNGNHFCHFLALGIGPLLWTLFASLKTEDAGSSQSGRSKSGSSGRSRFGPSPQRPFRWEMLVVMAGLAITALAGVLSYSRGGAFVMVIAGAITMIIYSLKKVIQLNAFYVIVAAGLLVACAAWALEDSRWLSEVDRLATAELDSIDSNAIRRRLWAADLELAAKFPLLGTGAGSHADAAPVTFQRALNSDATHAENGYVHLVMENGGLALGLALVGIGYLFVWMFRVLRSSDLGMVACGAGLIAALCVSLTQSLWDFIWYSPACLASTLAMAACLCRLAQLQKASLKSGSQRTKSSLAVGRLAWGSAAICLCGLLAMSLAIWTPVARAAGDWDNYLRVSTRSTESDIKFHSEVLGLRQVVRQNPHNGRAHLYLSHRYLALFDQRQERSAMGMRLHPIRQAANASGFASPAEVRQWVQAATGENFRLLLLARKHAQRALHLCPLLGEAYVTLALTDFLEGSQTGRVAELLEQAHRVRPFSGKILLAAGIEENDQGRSDQALELWKQAYQIDPSVRQEMIDALTPFMSPEFFFTEFQCQGTDALHLMRTYHKTGRPEEARATASVAVGMFEETASAAGSPTLSGIWWNRASNMHEFLKHYEDAVRCSQQAVKAMPNVLPYRQRLISNLLLSENFEEAERQLKWARSREPQNKVFEDLMVRARRGMLENQGAASASNPQPDIR